MKHAQGLDIPASKAANLYIYQAISSLVFTPLGGALINTKRIPALHLYQASLIVHGLSTILLPWIRTYEGLVGYVIVFGACNGSFVSLKNILVLVSVDYSHDLKASALGIQQFLNAIAILTGLPLAGWYCLVLVWLSERHRA